MHTRKRHQKVIPAIALKVPIFKLKTELVYLTGFGDSLLARSSPET